MLLQDVVRLLVRRWYVFVPLLCVSIVSATFAFRTVAPTYSADASLLLLPPGSQDAAPAGGATTNPIRGFDAGLVAAGTVVSIVLMDAATADAMKRRGVDDYDVAIAPSSVAPVVNVSVSSRHEAVTMAGLQDLVTMFSAELARRQQVVGAPRSAWIRASTLSEAARPERAMGKPIRAAAGVFGLGALAALGLTFAVDGARTRRRQRRDAAGDALSLPQDRLASPRRLVAEQVRSPVLTAARGE